MIAPEIAVTNDSIRSTIASYLDDLDATGHAADTMRSYRDKLAHFASYCDGIGISDMGDLTTDAVRAYVQQRRHKANSLNGLHAELRPVRAFLRWAALVEELIDERIPKRLRMPRKEKPIREPFTVEEVEALLEAAQASGWRGRETHMAARDYALMMVAFDTGCRAGELCNMKIGDLKGERIAVRMAKNGRGRMVPISEATRQAIEAWMEQRTRLAEGLPEPAKHAGNAKDQEPEPAWGAFLRAWYRTYGEVPRTVARALGDLENNPELRNAVLLALGIPPSEPGISGITRERAFRITLGAALARQQGVPHGMLWLERAGRDGHDEVALWRVHHAVDGETAPGRMQRAHAATSSQSHRRKVWSAERAADWLFTVRTGEQLTRHAVYTIFRRAADAADVVGAHPHRARRTVATEWIRSHGGLFELQALLGHSSLEMVRYYSSVAAVDVLEAHKEHGLIGRLSRTGNAHA